MLSKNENRKSFFDLHAKMLPRIEKLISREQKMFKNFKKSANGLNS
jgi:hypothetical protein